MIVVPRPLEGLVEGGHQLCRFDRRRLLRLRSKGALTVPGEEGEHVSAIPHLGQGELLHTLAFSVQIEQTEPAEVARDYPPRNLRVGQVVDVVERLLLSRDEIFAGGLHFDQRETRDQRVDVSARAGR